MEGYICLSDASQGHLSAFPVNEGGDLTCGFVQNVSGYVPLCPLGLPCWWGFSVGCNHGKGVSVTRVPPWWESMLKLDAPLHKSMTPCVTTKCSSVIVAKNSLRDTVIHSLYKQYYVGCISAVD